jgi:hypothetical protein
VNIAFLATYETESSLAFVVNVVTVFCLFTLYAMSPLNSLIIYPCELLRLSVLLANEALLAMTR